MPNINQYSIIYNGGAIHPPKTKPMEIASTIDSFDEMMQHQSNVLDEMMKQMTTIFVNKLDAIVEHGLRLKGFEFDSRNELEAFIKSNCVREHNLRTMQDVYYVKGLPFLAHTYTGSEMLMPNGTEREITASATIGEFQYL